MNMVRKNLLNSLFYIQKPSLLRLKKGDMLRAILDHAKNNVVYYSGLYVNPNELNDKDLFDCLEEMPLLTKDIINEKIDDLQTSKMSLGSYWNTSGGSTGRPIMIKQDYRYLACSRHITHEQKRLVGFNWGDRFIKIWGDDREIFTGKHSIRENFVFYLKNMTLINSFQMSNQKKIAALNEIKSSSPQLIVSYVQSIYDLACFAEDNSISGFSVGAIIVSAGTLYPFMRNKIEDVFGAQVFNRYGSREVGNISISTPNEPAMKISKGVWVEVVDSKGQVLPDGVEGEIVVTSLINYSMPLIRYRIGDRGVLGVRTDPKGNSYKVLENVTGRSVDLFTTENGDKVDGEYFTHLIYFKNWINRFQFIQKDLNSILVRLELKDSAPDSDLKEIEKKIKAVMGDKCQVKYEFVSKIIDPPSGKFRFTISEI